LALVQAGEAGRKRVGPADITGAWREIQRLPATSLGYVVDRMPPVADSLPTIDRAPGDHEPEDCGAIVEARKASTVAPQALFLLNDPFMLDSADALAARIALERPEGDLEPRLERLHGLLFGRWPTDEERELAGRFLAESGGDGWARLCHLLLCSNELIHVD
jgi:hypothetical protein